MNGIQEKSPAPSHFNDWPNSVGFDAHYEERNPVKLRVEGKIPSYVAGTLFRTGSGPRIVGTAANTTYKVNHWFDNFSQIHRFQIHPTQPGQLAEVTYTSRLLSDGNIEKVKKTGKLDGITFARQYDPCKSFFKKVQSVFYANPTPQPNETNIGVTIGLDHPGLSKSGQYAKGAQHNLMTRTDAETFQMLDPETLEPVGIAHQKTLHPDLRGPMSSAHAQRDPVTGDVFNFNLDFGKTGIYRLWKSSVSTGETDVLATIHHAPAYIHSLFLTENYVILCVWNSFFTMGGASILWHKNILDALKFDGAKPAKWFVVDKRSSKEGGAGLVASYESDPLFCFHTINAYEETSAKGTTDIVADMIGYDNMDILHHFYLEKMVSDSPNHPRQPRPANESIQSTYRRYRLASLPQTSRKMALKAICEHKASTTMSVELPTLAPSVATKKHRYFYGVSDSGKSSFMDSLVKYDVETGALVEWSQHGHTPGEAIFVPDPSSDEEDGGVLLTVVLDGIEGKSYLLVLDAKSLTEVARAHVDGVVGFAFHGLYNDDTDDTPDPQTTARL